MVDEIILVIICLIQIFLLVKMSYDEHNKIKELEEMEFKYETRYRNLINNTRKELAKAEMLVKKIEGEKENV